MGIFATVLYEILCDHQHDDYSYLGGHEPRTDPIWYPLRRLAIAPEAIQRLKSAANSKSKRAALNPSDLEYLMQRVHLEDSERQRLRVALIAQGVEIYLLDRLAQKESDVIADITQVIYGRLLESNIPLEGAKGSGFRRALTNDQRLELALALADRSGTFLLAAREAKGRKSSEEVHFWLSVLRTGYQECAVLLAPTFPDLAARFEQLVQGKLEDLLDASPARDKPPADS